MEAVGRRPACSVCALNCVNLTGAQQGTGSVTRVKVTNTEQHETRRHTACGPLPRDPSPQHKLKGKVPHFSTLRVDTNVRGIRGSFASLSLC